MKFLQFDKIQFYKHLKNKRIQSKYEISVFKTSSSPGKSEVENWTKHMKKEQKDIWKQLIEE